MDSAGCWCIEVQGDVDDDKQHQSDQWLYQNNACRVDHHPMQSQYDDDDDGDDDDDDGDDGDDGDNDDDDDGDDDGDDGDAGDAGDADN